MEADAVLVVYITKQGKFLLSVLSSCEQNLRICLLVFVTSDQRMLQFLSIGFVLEPNLAINNFIHCWTIS